MRAALTAFAAAGLVVPMSSLAAAPDSQASDLARELADPARQAEIAAMVQTMTNLLLEMPAAPLLRAAATMAGEDPEAIDENTTVGELAGPEAADAPHEVAVRLPQMMGAMAMLAASFEQMLPQLRAMGDTLARPDAADNGE